MCEMVYELVAPASLLKRMCEVQRTVCEEFIEAEGVETFNRLATLVNTIATTKRPTKKIMILEHPEFIQAVYKFVLLAQGVKSDSSRVTKFSFNFIWKGITPERRPSSNNSVIYVTREGQIRRMARIAKAEAAMRDAAD